MNKFLWTRAVTLILTAFVIAIIAGCSMTAQDRYNANVTPHKMAKTQEVSSIAGGLIGSATEHSRGGKTLSDKKRSWKHSSLSAHKVNIKVGDKESLPIHSMKASVKVDGFRARVILDYHFYNHHNRNYEATFQLRLPTGASPYYMAFGESIYKLDSRNYKNGDFQKSRFDKSDKYEPKQIRKSYQQTTIKMREARMVNKKKAVRAYHNTVQRRIDPALLEWTGSGVFNGRLFPVQAKKIHRVVIAYDLDLTQSKYQHHLRFSLPNKIKHKLIQYSIATVPGSRIKLGKYHQSIGTGHRKRIRVKNPKTSVLDLSVSRKASTTLVSPNKQGQSHFITQFNPSLKYRTSVSNTSKAVFLVDISVGTQPESFNRTVKLISQLLNRNETRIKEFAVLFFNSRGFWWRDTYTANSKHNRQQLRNFSNKLSLQGASDIDLALSMATHNKQLRNSSRAHIYLFSDGAANWGETQTNTITRKLKSKFRNKIFTFSTSTVGVNTQLLDRLSASTHGAHYTVTNNQEINRAATAIRANSWRIKSIRINGADIVVKGNPSHIYPGQTLTIAGRGRLNFANSLILTISDGRRTKTKKFRILPAIRSTLAARAYGLIAVDLMESYQRKPFNRLIESYALHYRVVGRNASLLMLESEKDYLSYNIKPADNKQLIEQTRASRIINSLINMIIKSTRSDKQVFISMLNQLKITDGVKSNISKELNKIISQLPRKDFELRFQLPEEYKAIDLLSDNSKNENETIDITSNKAQRIIIQKFSQLLSNKQSSRAVVALSSLVELNSNVKHMRLVSFYLLQMKQYRDAWHLFRQIVQRRPHEPPAYLSLARIAAENNNPELASLYYEILINSRWNSRYAHFAQLARVEYHILLTKILAKNSGHKRSLLFTSGYAAAQLKNLGTDPKLPNAGIMIAMQWNTFGNYIDLHIKDPSDEHIFYAHPFAKNGAILENFNSRSMGPEIYRTKKKINGLYRIGVKYYGAIANRKTLRTAVLLNIYKDLGTPQVSVERKVVLINKPGKVIWLKKLEVE